MEVARNPAAGAFLSFRDLSPFSIRKIGKMGQPRKYATFIDNENYDEKPATTRYDKPRFSYSKPPLPSPNVEETPPKTTKLGTFLLKLGGSCCPCWSLGRATLTGGSRGGGAGDWIFAFGRRLVLSMTSRSHEDKHLLRSASEEEIMAKRPRRQIKPKAETTGSTTAIVTASNHAGSSDEDESVSSKPDDTSKSSSTSGGADKSLPPRKRRSRRDQALLAKKGISHHPAAAAKKIPPHRKEVNRNGSLAQMLPKQALHQAKPRSNSLQPKLPRLQNSSMSFFTQWPRGDVVLCWLLLWCCVIVINSVIKC